MDTVESKYFKVAEDTGWIRDNKKSRLDKGYAFFHRTIKCVTPPNPATYVLIEREMLRWKYPGNRDFKVSFEGDLVKLSSVWDNSDD